MPILPLKPKRLTVLTRIFYFINTQTIIFTDKSYHKNYIRFSTMKLNSIFLQDYISIQRWII